MLTARKLSKKTVHNHLLWDVTKLCIVQHDFLSYWEYESAKNIHIIKVTYFFG